MKTYLLTEIAQEVEACNQKVSWYKQYLKNNPLSSAAHEAFFKYNSLSSQLTLWLDKFEQVWCLNETDI